MLFRLGWRNLWRHRRRTLITATAMAVGVAMCMAVSAFSDGMYAQLFDVMVVQRLGHVQVHRPDYPASRSLHATLTGAGALVDRIRSEPGTRVVAPRASGYALVGTEKKSVGAMLLGVDPDSERALGPIEHRIVKGRFLGPEAGEVTIGSGVAEDLELDVGDTLVAVTQAADGSLGNALFRVVGIHRTGDTQVDRMGVYLRLQDLQDLLALPDQVHGLTIVTDDPARLDPYADALRGAIGSDAVEVQTWRQASPSTAQMMSMSDVSSLILVGIVFGAAAFGVLNTMLMSVFERTRELGVLVAIGLRPPAMVGMIVAESVLLALVAGILGFALGGAFDWVLVRRGIDFSTSSGDGLSAYGVTLDPVIHGVVRGTPLIEVALALLAVSVGASLYPALRAARLRPVDAMRSE